LPTTKFTCSNFMLTKACPQAYYPSLPAVWGNHTLAATFRCGEYLNKPACGGIDGSCVHVQQSLLQLHRAIYLFTGVRCTRLTLTITAHAYSCAICCSACPSY
jgi:hypothetical protein